MRPSRGLASGRAALAALLLAAAQCAVQARAESLLIFAAASLGGPLDEAARAYESAAGTRVRISFAASSALARQIEAGAPAHLFISADLQWMQRVEARGLLAGPSVNLLANTLVLVAPNGRVPTLRIAPGFALAAALGDGRLALANPKAVPAGRYARSALETLGVWRQVEGRLAPAADVRAALALVARGEAPLGIVYRTDALAEPAVRIVDTFPAASHPPIVYALGVMRGAPRAATELAAFLASPAARPIWQRHGFGLP